MFTKLSVGSFQPNGIPVFDETQTNYVKEEMSLYRFTSSRVKIRFQLRTDESVARDGWYVDDRGIIFYSEIPVELSSSRAKTGSNGVILNWITTTELNKQGFEVEKAGNEENLNLVTLGFVEGSGTTTEIRNYQFIDSNPFTGIYYYRLKQIDYDGTSRPYNKIKVDFSAVTNYELSQNFRNPFNPVTTINYSLPVAGQVHLTVYYLLGSEVTVLVNEHQ